MNNFKNVMDRPVRSLQETAQILGISQGDVMDLISSGDLQAVGRSKQLIRSSDIMAFAYPDAARQKSTSSNRMLLVDVMKDLIETKRRSWKPKTLDSHINSAKHIQSAFPNAFIDELLPKDWELFFQTARNRITGQPLSNASIKNICKLVSMIYRYARVNEYYIANWSMRDITVQQGYLTDKDAKFLSLNDIGILLQTFKNHATYYTLTYALAGAGLRIGELLALEKRDINTQRNEITISKSLQVGEIKQNALYARERIIHYPKTDNAKRIVPVPPRLVNALLNYIAFQEQDKRLQSLKREKGTAKYIFVNQNGDLHCYHTLMYSYQKYLKRRLPVFRRVTFHMLRHSYGSLLLEQGISVEVVSRMLGHASIDITVNTYITITEKLYKNAATVCSHVLNQLDDIVTQALCA